MTTMKHIAVDTPKIEEIELHTRSQSTSMDSNTEQLWYAERRKRITASRVAGIAKMRKNTKTSNKVKEMLYTKFRGNAHTLYGVINESTSRNEYITYMHNHGHTGLTVSLSGLTISQQSPWIASSPDGMVLDPLYAPSVGLVELKNPSSVQGMTIVEACKMKKRILH